MRIARIIAAIAACAVAGWAEIGNTVVTSAANFERGMPWRGSIASVFCTGLTGIRGIVAADHYPLPLELAGVRVRIGGTLAPLFAVAQLDGYQQINLQVPWDAGFTATDITIEQAGEQARFPVPAVRGPGDFFRLADGSGAFQHAADYALVSTGNPARAGEVVIGYLTGLVADPRPPVQTGQPSPADPPAVVSQELGGGASRPRFEIWMGDLPNPKVVDPSFLGLAPGLAGVYQVNFTIPDGLATGNQPVRLAENRCATMFGTCILVRRSGSSLPVAIAVR